MSWLHPDEFRALMKRQTTLAYKDDLTEEERAIAHIEAMPPYPPGWMPETRR